jgi:hypothetical protein
MPSKRPRPRSAADKVLLANLDELKQTQHAFQFARGELQRVNDGGALLAKDYPHVFCDPSTPLLAPSQWADREKTSRAFLEGAYTVDGRPYRDLDEVGRRRLAVRLRERLRDMLERVARGTLDLSTFPTTPRTIRLGADVLEAWDLRIASSLAAAHHTLRKRPHRRMILGIQGREGYYFHQRKAVLSICEWCNDIFASRKIGAECCRRPECCTKRDEAKRTPKPAIRRPGRPERVVVERGPGGVVRFTRNR